MSRPRRPLSKTMLLPMDVTSAREQSLSYHLALATCRIGHGNSYLFNELIRTVYVAWFLQQAGYGDLPVALYKLAEYAVEAALTLAHESGKWLLADEALPAFEKLLALHDSQLAVAPLHKVVDAERQLARYLHGTASSPIPEGD